jgi:hypothetical protein
MNQPAQQGHRYRLYWGGDVLAMESGELVNVREIVKTPEGESLMPPMRVCTVWLEPLPMSYFHGDLPK